jgi:nucleotide-binding universal stress UspA family protein
MRLIVGIDGSKHSRWAMERATRLPLTEPSAILAVHALDLVSFRAPFVVQPVVVGNQPFIRAEITRLRRQATEVMADAKEFFSGAKVPVKVVLEKDAPASAILKHARREDLIVLGSRGLTAVDRFMLGSVSSNVATHARSSILIVKQPPRPIRRLLFATDGSKSAQRPLRFLTHDLRSDGVEALVVHVLPFLKYPELKEAGQGLLDREAERLLRAGYTVTETLRLGQAADEIIKVADRNNVDLVVAGANGLGAIARFFLGSVSTKLLHHTSSSILIVR